MNGNGAVVSAEDRQAWSQKAARKKEVANVLKKVLLERNQGRQRHDARMKSSVSQNRTFVG